MGTRLTRVLAVFGAVTLLVVGANAVAYAANGQSLLLGKKNKASKVTTVQRTANGPALALKTKNGSAAPFTTNAKGKVVNLNADKVDGLDGTAVNNTAKSALTKANAALAAGNDVTAIRFKDTAPSRGGNTTYALSNVPAGTYQVSFNASLVPNTRGTADLPTTVSCYLITPALLGGNVHAQTTVLDAGVNYVGPSFSTVLTLTGSETLSLTCTTSPGDGWDYDAGIFTSTGEPPTLSFVKLDGVTDRTMAP